MPAQTHARPGRNDPCRCGSGRKYKQCCLAKDEAADAKKRAAAAAAEPTAAPAGDAAPAAPKPPPKHQTQQPWKATTSRGFIPKARTPRKVGGS